MRCKKCDFVNKKNSVYCANCGEKYKDINGTILLLVGIALVIFSTGLFAINSLFYNPESNIKLKSDIKNNVSDYKKIVESDKELIKEYFTYKDNDFAIPFGLTPKIVDNNLVLVSDQSEYYCLFTINNGKYEDLRYKSSDLRQFYETKGYKVGTVETSFRNKLEWTTIQLTEKEESYLIAHSYLSNEKYITVLINKDGVSYEYSALEVLEPLIIDFRKSIQ